jgi:Ca2+-transporting ATPase
LILIVYLPILQRPFQTFGLSRGDWCIVVAPALSITPVLEISKWFERRGWFGKLD